MNKRNILVVRDEACSNGAKCYLVKEGYEVTEVGYGQNMLGTLCKSDFDLVVLDIQKPLEEQYRLCAQIKYVRKEVPVFLILDHNLNFSAIDQVRRYASDYIVAPFMLKELLNRVKALLSANDVEEGFEEILELPGLTINRNAMKVYDENEQEIRLTKKEFKLLLFFCEQSGKALTRENILAGVWGPQVFVDVRTVDNFVSSLNRKMELNCKSTLKPKICSVRGVGYRMDQALTCFA